MSRVTPRKPSNAAVRALRRAMARPRGTICPIVGVHSAAETALLESLIRNGWAEMRGVIPVITDKGCAIAVSCMRATEG